MNLTLMTRQNPQRLLIAFVMGSLSILLLCLLAGAFIFSGMFLRKEDQRATIAKKQLQDAITYQYRYISEETWTKNWDAIAYRLTEVSRQFGNADFSLIMTDENGKCVYQASNEGPSSSSCNVPSYATILISKFKVDKNIREPELVFDEASSRYEYSVPISVGAVLKGYLFATISDPYGFVRGNASRAVTSLFLPGIIIILLVWFLWLAISRRWILKPYLQKLLELEKEKATGRMAAQVAHDIQSPLSALMRVVQTSIGLPMLQAQLLRSAAFRIQNISDDLLSRHRNSQERDREIRFSMITPVVNSILAEKAISCASITGVDLDTAIDPNVLTLGVAISSSDLSRVISNLVNNAFDACEEKSGSKISVRVTANADGAAQVVVEDTGHGMSREILHKVRTQGGSYGKAKGAGLGLQFTKEIVGGAGGRVDIESTPDIGTRVILTIPAANRPEWCADRIEIEEGCKVVVLDDDESVHLLWKEKLADFDVAYLRDPEEFDVNKYPKDSYRYILDYEIQGSPVTGLDLIKSFNLGSRALLVTSYFNDQKIQSSVAKAHARLLPKVLVPNVDVRRLPAPPRSMTVDADRLDAVLIDNDPIVHDIWKIDAKRAKKRVELFRSEAEFLAASIPKEVPVFVDYHLEGDVLGTEVGRRLRAAGYSSLYLATGRRPHEIAHSPWFRAIIGKEFPDQILNAQPRVS